MPTAAISLVVKIFTNGLHYSKAENLNYGIVQLVTCNLFSLFVKKVFKMKLSRQQIRTIMYYEFCNKLSATECHQKMCESLGINTVSYDTVKVWFRKFKAGNFNIENEPRSGRPIEVDCEQLKQIIDQDRNISTRNITLQLDVCQKPIVKALQSLNLTFN